LETNYIGVLGELAIRQAADLTGELERNYEKHEVDSGDVLIDGKMFDVKTEAIPEKWFQKLASGKIKQYDPYGCRVFTAKHAHHLKKYSGGIIFCSIPILANEESRENKIRESLLLNREIIVPGFTTSKNVKEKESTWFTPEDPRGKKRKYNSKNYIFHHSELQSLKTLISNLV
jgi:hypothetical protein